MVKYEDGSWHKKAQMRKAVRDTEWNKFVAALGTTPASRMDDVQFSPIEQRKKVVSLMKVTRDGEMGGDHMDAMTEMAKALLMCGLGKGAMGSVAKSILSPHLFHSNTALDFFTRDYLQRDMKD